MKSQKSVFVFFIWLLICSGLVSCDPYGGFVYWIDNQSDSSVFVTYHGFYNDTIVKTKLETNSTIMIGDYSETGGVYDKGDEFLSDFFDTISIQIDTSTNEVIKKDYQKREMWDYSKETTGLFGKAGRSIYKFRITNKDL